MLYLERCAGCHKARGVGVPGAFPPLNLNPVVNAADPADIIEVVLHGVPAKDKYTTMPGFADSMSDIQIAEVINYIRSGWDNHAIANTEPDMVAKRRKKSD